MRMASFGPLPSGIVPTHHPDEAVLLDFASGAADEAVALLIAAHLAWCSACRERVAELERLGGAMLAAIDPVPMAEDTLAAVLARVDRDDGAGRWEVPPDGMPESAASARSARTGSPFAAGGAPPDGLPWPIATALNGRGLDQLAWRRVGRGLERCDLDWGRSATRSVLLRLAPGCRVTAHGHAGRELTLVLVGGFADERGHYLPGDVAVVESGDDHRPVADDGLCICLSVNEGPLRPAGWVGRVLSPPGRLGRLLTRWPRRRRR